RLVFPGRRGARGGSARGGSARGGGPPGAVGSLGDGGAMSTTPMLSLIIPAYNEARSIGNTLQAIRSYLDQKAYTHRLLGIAGGNEGTGELVAARAAGDGRVSVFGTVGRRGKGCAVRQGVMEARGQIIGFADADYKTPIEEIDKVLPWFERGYDLVIGS